MCIRDSAWNGKFIYIIFIWFNWFNVFKKFAFLILIIFKVEDEETFKKNLLLALNIVCRVEDIVYEWNEIYFWIKDSNIIFIEVL